MLALLPLWGQGDIVFTPYNGDLTPMSPPDELQFLDINADGVDDFKFTAVRDDPFQMVSVLGLNSSEILFPLQEGVINVLAVQGGEVIDSSALGGSARWADNGGILSHWDFQYPIGEILGGPFLETNAFLGVSFQINSETHYGWIQIDNPNNTPGGTITGFAYETESGRGISAGAIPEPGSVALFTMGGLGLYLLRKNKK